MIVRYRTRGRSMVKRLRLFLVAAFALACFPALAQQAPAQKWTTAKTYTVVAGYSVPIIVRRVKYPSVSESQMYYAFVQANINNFSMDTVERVLPGMKMRVPPEAEV